MIVLISACLTVLSVAKTDEPIDNLDLSQARELFLWYDTEIYLHLELASWNEARVICEAENMHLANLENVAKTKFIAQSISEAWVTYEDMWIGAQRNERGQWVWTFTNESLPNISPKSRYPPWINRKVPSREGTNCLVLDSNDHDNPYFVDLNCKQRRSFICEKPSDLGKTKPRIANTISDDEIEYVLYHGHLTWAESVSFCRQQDFILSSVKNMMVVKKMGTAMLKARPEVQEAWIGANLQNNQWVWIGTEENVKIIPAKYKNPSGSKTAQNIITPEFPPWFTFNNSSSINKCVLLNRYSCENPQFIAESCDRKRNFICMKSKKDDVLKNERPVTVVERDKKRFSLFQVEVSWEKAKLLCEEIGDNSSMLKLTDIQEAKFIIKMMSNAKTPIDHLWLGGRLIDDKWCWVGRNKHVVPIPIDIDQTGFPPWCDITTDENLACLNLDRQYHWTPLIYGLECNATQAVICVQPVVPKDKAVSHRRSGRKSNFTALKITKLEDTLISWTEAERACDEEIGKLWKPNLDSVESMKEVETLLDGFMAEGEKSEVKQFYVDGGIYSKKENAWVYKGQKSRINTTEHPRDGDCLVVRTNGLEQEWEWLPVDCHTKLQAQIICEPCCSLSEVPYEEEKSDWVCESGTSSFFGQKMLGMSCSHRCSKNQVLQGPGKFYCGAKRGWIYKQYPNIYVNASKCIDLSNALHFFSDIPKNVSTLVFIIDSTKGNLNYYNAAKFLMGNLVEYYKFQVTKITVHVVSIEFDYTNGDGAVVKVIDFIPSSNCEDIRNKVLLPLNDVGDGITDYGSAFLKAKSILERSDFSTSHIVLLAENSDEIGNFRTVASSLHQKSHVYVIGLNRKIPNGHLIDLASIVDGVSYSIQFKIAPHVNAAVRGLISKYCPNCTCQAAFQKEATYVNFRKRSPF